jgi:taurine--2-oxoglutarate transaminase
MTTAKGITSGYVPLSATIVRPQIRDQFIKSNFIGGVTTEAHTLACATAIANIEVYERERLIERSAEEGRYLLSCLSRLREKHPSVGDIRGMGLFACIELTSNREQKAPLAGHRNVHCDVATGVTRKLLELGLFVVAKWDFLFIAPPLVTTRAEIDEAMHKIDLVLTYTDELASTERRRRER